MTKNASLHTIITRAKVVVRVGRLSALYVCAYVVCVCVSTVKQTTGLLLPNLRVDSIWQVLVTYFILGQKVKMSNVKVGMSLHSFNLPVL